MLSLDDDEGFYADANSAAMAGYVLRQWQVDYSIDRRIEDLGCRLWLRDVLALYGVNSVVPALGYQNDLGA